MSAFDYPNSFKRFILFCLFMIVGAYSILYAMISYAISIGQSQLLVVYTVSFFVLFYFALIFITEIWGSWILTDPKYYISKQEMKRIGNRMIIFEKGKLKFKEDT